MAEKFGCFLKSHYLCTRKKESTRLGTVLSLPKIVMRP